MKIQHNYIKTFGFSLILVSLGLLIYELIEYNRLPSMKDPISDVVDFTKYKENAVTNGIIWIGFLIAGILLTFRTKLNGYKKRKQSESEGKV